ncbi:MAG: mannose-1-phosphate guanylyltransferase [Chitinophagales bacterium]|nr:mannose-1-phosphate guanylyltransferase [Chitinophagales bacterium]
MGTNLLKMNLNNYAVIMAGGIGSRFWPHSRVHHPKQFLDILNTGKTLLQETYQRFLPICNPENIFIVTNEDYAQIVHSQIPNLQPDQLLIEPTRRNTAPCVAYACQKIACKNPNANIIVSPSDHQIFNEDKFRDIVTKAFDFVSNHDSLITIGIRPTRPDTGYGYIQYVESDTSFAKKVKTFTEKPSLEIAKAFIQSGEFLWNSGIFIWNFAAIKKAFDRYLPEVSILFKDAAQNLYTPKEKDFIETVYAQITNISLDYAIMEKSDNVYVIPSDFGWSDVGTWASVYDLHEKDYLGNAVNGKQVKIYSGSNNMIVAPKNKLVVIDGLENYCVIDTADVLMIIPKDKEQEVKNITTDIKRDKLDKYL